MMSYRIDGKPHGLNIASCANIKQKLNSAKDQLDGIYKKYNYAGRVMKSFDPFHTVKYKIAKRINADNVTIAWLKGYELISTFNLMEMNLANIHGTSANIGNIEEKSDPFVYFDNAAFPGSFILAMNHYAKTVNREKLRTEHQHIKWYASSLLANTHANQAPLEDSYALYKNYPNNWLMNLNNNGDISNIENINNFQVQMEQKEGNSHSVDLYTCDLGMDVSDDYNNQELLHSYLNICQIFCGLAVLKPGGNLAVKHYTLFEPITIKYLTLLSQLFGEMYITKPLTSKRTNSEVYIVCKNYYLLTNHRRVIYDLFMECVINKNTSPMEEFEIAELFENQQILKNITQNILRAINGIFIKQTQSLNQYIYSMKNMSNPLINRRCEKEVFSTNNIIRRQFYKIPLLRISHSQNLRTIRKYYKDKKRYNV